MTQTVGIPGEALVAIFIIAAIVVMVFVILRARPRTAPLQWITVAPTIPPPTQQRQPLRAANDAAAFTFDLAINDIQQIEFDIPLTIELRSVQSREDADPELRAAIVDITAGGSAVNTGEHVEKLSFTQFRMLESVGPSDGFTVHSLQFFEKQGEYRAFSIAVTRVILERGTAAFTVLCARGTVT